MPYTNFPFYIQPVEYEVSREHLDYSVLFFETGDSAFIVVAKTRDLNHLTQLAAGITNQTGFIWDGHPISAEEHNEAVIYANTKMVEYFG